MAQDTDVTQVSNSRLNWLRAAVLGANDGIVSVASIILGVAGATDSKHTIYIAGLAGLVAGAFSMAIGEYVSVSSQRDAEEAFIKQEKHLLKTRPAIELDQLTEAYMEKGLSKHTAREVAEELTKRDALRAHLEMHSGLDPDDLNSPTHAAIASMSAFTAGGLIPLVAVLVSPADTRIVITFVAVIIALIVTGYASATVGGASRRRAIMRVVIGGAAAMVLTYLVGHVFGTTVM